MKYHANLFSSAQVFWICEIWSVAWIEGLSSLRENARNRDWRKNKHFGGRVRAEDSLWFLPLLLLVRCGHGAAPESEGQGMEAGQDSDEASEAFRCKISDVRYQGHASGILCLTPVTLILPLWGPYRWLLAVVLVDWSPPLSPGQHEVAGYRSGRTYRWSHGYSLNDWHELRHLRIIFHCLWLPLFLSRRHLLV